MKTYTIEKETNNITAHRTAREAESVPGAERFGTAAALARLAANWPTARLLEIWNSLPGATPVKKFKDRESAVARIWKAIQNLGEVAPAEASQKTELAPPNATAVETSEPKPEATPATPVAPHTPDVAPRKLASKSTTSRANKPTGPATAKNSRTGSKTETILSLLKRPGGASLKEIMQTTGWQAHSVRGFVSGTLGKKMNLTVVSTKTEDGERSYSIQA